MSLKDKLRKAAGLFIELSPETSAPVDDLDITPLPAEPKTVEHIVRDADGPNLDEIAVPATTTPQTAALPDGTVDFASLYQQAGLTPVPYSAEQMLEMIASLPQELPLETKRQTVRSTLNSMGKAMGITPESIVTDASRKLAALAAYTDHISKQTTDFIAATEMEVANLQAQITEKRNAVDAARQQQTQTVQACTSEANRLDDVLEFFSLDVPPSKYAPPPKGK